MRTVPLIALGAALLITSATACSSSNSKDGTQQSSAVPAAGGAGGGGGASSVAHTSSSNTSGTSGGPSRSASTAGDPCSLLTAAQIKTAFGGTVAEGVKDTDPDIAGPTCTWAVTGSNLGSDGDIAVTIPTALQGSKKFGYAKDGSPGSSDVPGVGDSAFYQPQGNAVNLLKGETVAIVQGTFAVGSSAKPDPATIKAEVIALAGDAAQNL